MKNITAFLLGVGVGAGVTIVVSKKIFTEAGRKVAEEAIKQHAEEEIESVKAAFKALEDEKRANNPELKENAEKALSEYQGIEPAKKNDIPDDEPYIIKPEDFNSPNQEIISLLYYAKNQKLVYASGGVVVHPEDLFDLEFLNRFGEYAEDMLYVRDPVEGVDYDIEYRDERYKDKG